MKNKYRQFINWLMENKPEVDTLLYTEADKRLGEVVSEIIKDALEEGAYKSLLSLECGVVVLEAMIEYLAEKEEYLQCAAIQKVLKGGVEVIDEEVRKMLITNKIIAKTKEW